MIRARAARRRQRSAPPPTTRRRRVVAFPRCLRPLRASTSTRRRRARRRSRAAGGSRRRTGAKLIAQHEAASLAAADGDVTRGDGDGDGMAANVGGGHRRGRPSHSWHPNMLAATSAASCASDSKLHTEAGASAADAFAARRAARARDAADAWLGRQRPPARSPKSSSLSSTCAYCARRRPRPEDDDVGSSSMTRCSRIRCDRLAAGRRGASSADAQSAGGGGGAGRRRRLQIHGAAGRTAAARACGPGTSFWVGNRLEGAGCRAPPPCRAATPAFMRALEAALGPTGGGAAPCAAMRADGVERRRQRRARESGSSDDDDDGAEGRTSATASSWCSWCKWMPSAALAKGRRLCRCARPADRSRVRT